MCLQVYLRNWAKDLDVPILSIDYSLAPESPFPRALEECFYVYAWAVLNCDKLGQWSVQQPNQKANTIDSFIAACKPQDIVTV